MPSNPPLQSNDTMAKIELVANEISEIERLSQHAADPELADQMASIAAVFRTVMDDLIDLPEAMSGVTPWEPRR